MALTYFSSSEQQQFQSPVDWEFSIYSFEPRKFWFSKTSLQIAKSCEVVRWDFRGQIRFRAGLCRPKLQIHFIDGHSSDSSLQGRGRIDSVMMITVGGQSWDAVSRVRPRGVEINFDEETSRQIFSACQESTLEKLLGKERSFICPLTVAGTRMKNLAQKYLHVADASALSDLKQNVGEVDASFDLQSFLSADESFREKAFVEIAVNVIDEATGLTQSIPERSTEMRRAVALEVEKMLWRAPFSFDDDFSGSLAEFSRIFRVSSRSIQIGIQEQFGVGFVALRRLIRLHQVRNEIYRSRGAPKITTIASDYGMHFGRLSQDYKELFGLLPSADAQIAQKQTR